jgi:hypothetical protein
MWRTGVPAEFKAKSGYRPVSFYVPMNVDTPSAPEPKDQSAFGFGGRPAFSGQPGFWSGYQPPSVYDPMDVDPPSAPETKDQQAFMFGGQPTFGVGIHGWAPPQHSSFNA